MFYYIIGTTFQKIGDLFCPVVFLDFRTLYCTNFLIKPLFTCSHEFHELMLQTYFFLAQQWKLTPEGKLENRLRKWAYGKKNSTLIPSYGMQGIINISKKYGQKKLLTFPAKGNAMKYREELPQRFKSSQLWDIGYPDNQGWFNISSSKAIGKYLTVTKIGYSNELTMEIEGTLYWLLLSFIFTFSK